MMYFRHIQVFYEVLVVLFFIYSLWIAVISLIFLTNPQVFVNPSVPSVHLWMCSELGPEVAQGYPCGLTALSVPQNPAAGMSLGSVSGKKRGEWTTRRQDYGWCVDFYFTLSAFGFGGFELWSGFFLCGSSSDCIWDHSRSVNALPQVFTVQGVLSSLLFSTKCFLRAD